MVWSLKDKEVDLNEAPCRCMLDIKTKVQMQEVMDWVWKWATHLSKMRQENKDGNRKGIRTKKNGMKAMWEQKTLKIDDKLLYLFDTAFII